MKIESISNIMQRLDIAHMIATLFQNAEKATKIVSSEKTQRSIVEETQKPTDIEKPSKVEDKKQTKKPDLDNPKNLDILA